MYSNILYFPESQCGDHPLYSCGFFKVKERLSRKLKKIAYISFSGEMKSKCIRKYIDRRVLNVVINPFTAAFFFFFFFFERKERFARKWEKIAYLSFSGEMKSECIRIFIVRKVLNVAINPFRAEFFF